MNDKLPFEDAFERKMNDLPAGNEDASWQKMQAMLEEKDKRKPFAWINIYTICTSIMIIAGFSIWTILSYHNNAKKDIATAEKSKNSKKIIIKNEKLKANELLPATQPGETLKQKNSISSLSQQMNKSVTNTSSNKISSLSRHKKSKIIYNNYAQQNQIHNNKTFVASKSQHKTITQNNISKNDFSQPVSDRLESSNAKNQTEVIKSNNVTKNDSVKTQINVLNIIKQSAGSDTNTSNKQTNISLKLKRQYFIEAGIQVKQQIPINGQKIISSNYNGKKEIFTDYIPSAAIKFEKNKQWFIQDEFNYAAPHLIKQFSYSRQTKTDYALSTVTTTTMHLQKVYYNEMPVSFNYYIQPRWSIGAGVSFSWFCGAVAEKETAANDIKSGAYTNTTQMTPFKMFTDSFLYKNKTSLLLQTGYSVKKWSFNFRYTKDIEPYIKYTLPNGAIETKKNASLELLIGYYFFRTPVLQFKKK